jgi:hypothetical protein
MPSTFTANLVLELQATGDNNNTWGTKENSNLSVLDGKLGSVTSISTTGGTTTLSTGQELVGTISVSGALVSDATIVFSGRPGFWIVDNQTSNLWAVLVNVSGQVAVPIQQGESALVWCNGTNMHKRKRYPVAPVVLTDGATVPVDARLSDRFTLTAAGNRQFVISNPSDQQAIVIYHTASGANRTASFDASVDLGLLTPIATTSGKTDIFGLIYSAALGKWCLAMQLQGY